MEPIMRFPRWVSQVIVVAIGFSYYDKSIFESNVLQGLFVTVASTKHVVVTTEPWGT
jgi:hypothetical protein